MVPFLLSSFLVDHQLSTTTVTSAILLDGLSLLNMTQVNPFKNALNRTLDLLLVNDDIAEKCILYDPPEPLTRVDPHHPPFLVVYHCQFVTRFRDIVEHAAYDLTEPISKNLIKHFK